MCYLCHHIMFCLRDQAIDLWIVDLVCSFHWEACLIKPLRIRVTSENTQSQETLTWRAVLCSVFAGPLHQRPVPRPGGRPVAQLHGSRGKLHLLRGAVLNVCSARSKFSIRPLSDCSYQMAEFRTGKEGRAVAALCHCNQKYLFM